MAFNDVYQPCRAEKTFHCPCCGFKTLYGRGCLEICRVCFWEDDGQDDMDADERYGGPNHISLTEGRVNFIRYGVFELRHLSRVRKPLEDEI